MSNFEQTVREVVCCGRLIRIEHEASVERFHCVPPDLCDVCSSIVSTILAAHNQSVVEARREEHEQIKAKLPKPVEIGAKYEIERDWPGLHPNDAMAAHNFGYDHGFNAALQEVTETLTPPAEQEGEA